MTEYNSWPKKTKRDAWVDEIRGWPVVRDRQMRESDAFFEYLAEAEDMTRLEEESQRSIFQKDHRMLEPFFKNGRGTIFLQ